jgi:hypothetical protein
MTLAVPLVGQDQTPDKDKQKQEEPKAPPSSNQKGEAPPQAPEEKPKSARQILIPIRNPIGHDLPQPNKSRPRTLGSAFLQRSFRPISAASITFA